MLRADETRRIVPLQGQQSRKLSWTREHAWMGSHQPLACEMPAHPMTAHPQASQRLQTQWPSPRLGFLLGKAGGPGWDGMACPLRCLLTGCGGLLENFFVCAALLLDLTAIGIAACPSGVAVANLGSLRRVLGPPSHSLTCHFGSLAGVVLWMDRRSRACMLCNK
jgi:hypothetical protein